MATEFKLPELGEGVDSADVSRIHVSEGDEIGQNQNVMELETEKAVADLPCPHSGKISEIHVSAGDTIQVGQTLLSIEEGEPEAKEEAEESQTPETEEPASETEEEKPQDEEQPQAEAEEAQAPETEAPQAAERSEQQTATQEEPSEKTQKEQTAKEQGREAEEKVPPPAGPATRRLARKLGIDLKEFQPAGDGRIKQEDVVRAYVESGKVSGLTGETLPDFSQFGPVEREPLNKVAQTAARRLTAAWRAIPHVTQHGQADVTALETARQEYEQRAGDQGTKITLTSIALKAVTGLLKEFPKFNASFDTENDELVLKRYYHLGIAVDTDHGLLVPVIRDVDRKSLQQIAAEVADIAAKARNRQLGKEDFEGGTFTLSNQGGIGGGEFTPIINYPEVAILGIGRTRHELRLKDGLPVERKILPLSLSYDHRVINGADAARFISRLTTILDDKFSLLVTI